MSKNKSKISFPDEVIMSKIYFIRGKKVMLDRDISELYGVLMLSSVLNSDRAIR